MATRFMIDLISDDPRKADYVRTLLKVIVDDWRLTGDLVTMEFPLEEGEDGDEDQE